MKFRILSIAIVGILAGSLLQAQTCQAQIKPVLFPGLSNAPEGKNLIQGMPITLNLKNPANEKVKGTLVWGDDEFLVVRTQSEGLPRKINRDNVENMEDIGKIKPVAIPEPEILTVSIHNGPEQYNQYFSGQSPQLGGSYLSKEEERLLDNIASAEKAMGTAQGMLNEARQMLNNATALENQKAMALAAYYQNARLYALGFRTPPIVDESHLYYSPGIYSPYSPARFGGYGYYYRGPQVTVVNSYQEPLMPNPVAGVIPGASSEDLAKVALAAQKEASDMLAQARKDYEQARNLALYSSDGRLVAVRTWE
jgi:hypothetical protein